VVMREVQRKLDAMKASQDDDAGPPPGPKAMSDLGLWLERAERVRTQKRNDKNKLYALHAPEVECISKGKARTPYEFGVKVSLTVTHKQGLMVGARSFPGNPYDGHVLSAQLEQTRNLLQDLRREPKQVVVDLGYRGVDADSPGVEIIHRGKYKTLSTLKKRLLKRRQARSMLAAGRHGRRTPCDQLRGGLQHPLAAACHRRPGRGSGFFAPIDACCPWPTVHWRHFDCRRGRLGRSVGWALAPQRGRRAGSRRRNLNFAGPTT
jgi:IS5 family transposase